MSYPFTKTRSVRQGGFTLIELLVVIIILGILSAVVVFAVRGVGDKGQDNAIATDKRILRTAQESYCARYGKYAENDGQLVNPSTDLLLASQNPGTKGFLSQESETHEVGALYDGTGPCNGWSFTIDPLDDNDTEQEPPVNCEEGVALSGTWCLIEPPPARSTVHRNHEGMVQLQSGKVLTIGLYYETLPVPVPTPAAAFLYDPTKSKGAWTKGPDIVAATHGAGLSTPMVRLDDDPRTPQSECASPPGVVPVIDNCGKVLVLAGGDSHNSNRSKWYLYDPKETPESPQGSWTMLGQSNVRPGESNIRRWAYQTRTTQIRGTEAECESNCGKVLIVGGGVVGQDFDYLPIAELFDPKTNTFELSASHKPLTRGGVATAFASLPEGKILMVNESELKPGGIDEFTQVFDPSATPSGSFNDAPPPPVGSAPDWNPLVVLPDGSVLRSVRKYTPPPPGTFVGAVVGPPLTSIYRPDADGGKWTETSSCSSEEGQCFLKASLPDGSVLAVWSSGSSALSNSPETGRSAWRFGHGPPRWAPTGSIDQDGLGVRSDALLLSGACTPNCGKVLVVGRAGAPGNLSWAALYTP